LCTTGYIRRREVMTIKPSVMRYICIHTHTCVASPLPRNKADNLRGKFIFPCSSIAMAENAYV
jgi:hypothetical protein